MSEQSLFRRNQNHRPPKYWALVMIRHIFLTTQEVLSQSQKIKQGSLIQNRKKFTIIIMNCLYLKNTWATAEPNQLEEHNQGFAAFIPCQTSTFPSNRASKFNTLWRWQEWLGPTRTQTASPFTLLVRTSLSWEKRASEHLRMDELRY